MAEKWQQWMPFHIDRFRGSLHVQGMPSAAKLGYIYLLAAQWQSDDCALPNDDFELQILSGLTQEEWTRLGPLILRRFPVRGDNMLANAALTTEWTETKRRWAGKQPTEEEKHELKMKRREAGKAGALKRWADKKTDSKTDGKKTVCHQGAIGLPEICYSEHTKNQSPNGKPIATDMASYGLTEQNRTVHRRNKVPSRAESASDPRHVPFRDAVTKYATFMGVKLPWDGSEAKALDRLLRASPDLSLTEFQSCLNHRAKSRGTPHGDRPRLWIPNVLKYQQGPLNEFGKTGESNGNHGKTGHSIDAAQQALAILDRQEADRAAADAAGYPEAGEVGHGRLLGAG